MTKLQILKVTYMFCPPVRGLSPAQVDNHDTTNLPTSRYKGFHAKVSNGFDYNICGTQWASTFQNTYTERMQICAKLFQECMYTPQMALSCCCFSFSTLCLPVQNNLDYCLAETQLNTQGEDRIHV